MNNQISCDPVCFRSDSLPEFFPLAAELEFASVEVPFRIIEQDPTAVASLQSEFNLKIVTVQIEEGLLTNPERLAETAATFQVISDLGATMIVGSAGDVQTEQEYDQRIEQLKQLGDLAAKQQILLCLETKPGLCQDHHAMARTMNDIDHAQVKLSFDTAGLHYYNDNINGEIALSKICHLVRHIRLSDSQGEYGKWYFPALGYGGAVDFLRVLDIMNNCGFAGPFCISIAGIAGEEVLAIDQLKQRMRDSLETLRTCGYFR